MSSSGSPVLAAGLMVFRIVSTKIEYLLLQASNADHGWTPPKGHVDPGETELIAAQRETKEEAGLGPEDYDIIPGFESVLQYEAWNKPKKVTYWAAKIKDNSKQIQISSEHQAYNWFELQKLLETTNRANMQDSFRKCEKFLQEKYFSNAR